MNDGEDKTHIDEGAPVASQAGASPAAASELVGLEPEIEWLQRELRNSLEEDPGETIQRLGREIKSAGEIALAAGLSDSSRRPEEADPRAAALAAARRRPKEDPQKWPEAPRKSKKVAEAWASSKGVTDEQAATVLQDVRERAESWRTGTASVLAVITATLVLGGETFKSIKASTTGAPLVPYAIAVSAGLALISLYFTLRAANGPAFLDTKIRETVTDASARDLRRAGAAAGNLKLAQTLLTIAVMLFLAALVTMWVAPGS